MNYLFILLALSGYIGLSASQIIQTGQCDTNVTGFADLNLDLFSGRWREIESLSTSTVGTCQSQEYSRGVSADTVNIISSHVLSQTLNSETGYAFVEANDNATWNVYISNQGIISLVPESWVVLDTDYTSYALIYSCENLSEIQRRISAWKLSRTSSLPTAAATAIDQTLAAVDGLAAVTFTVRQQSAEDCFYFPAAVSGQSVVFPGQCDATVAAVAAFNRDTFAGTWYQTSAYPITGLAVGECVTHELAATTTGFTANTTAVTSSELVTTSSVLTTATTDGSAQFTLSAVINNEVTEIPFWILSTDYTNYAVAYGCVNIDNDRRQIFSWILSRTTELSTASSVAVNTTISSIVTLAEVYYDETQHTDEACFYYPDFGLGEPIILDGQCDPNIAVVQNFDVERYSGVWRLIETYYAEFQTGDCIDATYTPSTNGVIVVNSQVINTTLDTITGSAVPASDTEGKLLVTFPIAGTDFTVTSEYWVLATDYDSYALVYSCANVTATTRRIFSWKMSRTRALTTQATAAIATVVEALDVLKESYFQVIDHSDASCFYYPEAGTFPLVFRGQCDSSVAMSNFNASSYMGLWHSIESYFTFFEQGTCNNARYTLNEDLGLVYVYNTQVVNQTLDDLNGFATVASTDGSAQLNVYFPTADGAFLLTSSANYWVVDTDYTSYALVLSCTNLSAETRYVTSWKLSRSKAGFTAAAAAAINTAISGVDVIDDRYFEAKVQTDAACFYYPEPVVGKPVVFPGACDNTVAAVANFNLNNFQGLWYETAAYPRVNFDGECVNYNFDVTTTGFSVTSGRVLDYRAITQNGTGTLDTTDNSGKYLITTTDSNGETITFPFWILATDYTSYALAYSCVDLEDDMRAITAWKLSRTPSLPAAGEAALLAPIAANVVLDNDYFEETSQSDDSCFVLPNLSLNEPVILPGQCDESIAPIENFDAAGYAGLWYNIASYYSEFATGACTDLDFTVNADGTFTITHEQVVSERLEYVTGTGQSVNGTGRLQVTFQNTTIEYLILGTDYVTYSLVYSCENLTPTTTRINSWKLGRDLTFSAGAEFVMNLIIDQIPVLNEDYYSSTDYSEAACFYYPEANANSPPVFRGQCDSSLQAVQNFDIDAYMGLWYDISSFPQGFQRGSCPTAQYTFMPEGYVAVHNTEVVNQQLFDISGVASPSVNDGSAKLVVSFPVFGEEGVFTESPYWVLSTDYTNYALVYSCTNLDPTSFRITSWKLSRTQSLSAAAETAIDSVVGSVRGLSQDYYTDRDQSAEGCFFFPDNEGGPVVLGGTCSTTQTVDNFNTAQFSGTWYEHSRYPSDLQNGSCDTITITVDGTPVDITFNSVVNQTLVASAGSATNDGSGVLAATFPTATGSEQLNLHVVATDYNTYALIYSCSQLTANTKQIYSWILGRETVALGNAALQQIAEAISTHPDLGGQYYEETARDSQACFYYPQFDDSVTSIELPGVCDTSVQGVSNFNINSYLGRWYEVARYPRESEQGDCGRVSFGVTASNYVFSEEIVNNASLLLYQGGVSVTTNGLMLVFGSTGNELRYVLATDYNNYALMYSCTNLNNGNRRVSSWKLSRSPTLDAQSSAAIDLVVAATDGLREEYFRAVDQSQGACFYVPEVNENSAAQFRGTCGDVAGVTNFNISSFVGWWHEHQSYPRDQILGCVSLEVAASGSQYTATDYHVAGLQGISVASTLTADANGRLVKTFADGTTQEVFVLATDYSTYALLYSCAQISEEYSEVWSAKYTKLTELPAAAETALTPIIEANLFLQSNFFLTSDQSASTCFHYPEVTGQAVILPGQCDENIPVQQNFDAVQYSGVWYQTERYPQAFESGACSGARYTVNGDGSVTVLNFEVVDGELQTVEGSASVASADGSAKLTVELPIPGTNIIATSSLYVLSTDYSSYSLAYSCSNVNDFQRTVTSWKLSRTRTMPTSGSAAINAIINQRDELYQPYYVTVAQSDDCPEPSSAAFVTSSLLVLTVCALLQFWF